ncbi:hypothetical protein BH10CHL1_BH10CHL1_39890 [soil metagenome]
MSFELRLLGGFQAQVDGQPVRFATNFARALLAYLAMEARPCERTTLVGLLWPDQPEASARQSLRQTLFYLRQALGDRPLTEQTLMATTKPLHVQEAAIDLDVRRFQQGLAACATHAHADLLTCPACIERLRQAADLYGGDFLHGLVVKGSQTFEEWTLFLREQLHRQAVEVYYTLAKHAQLNGDYGQMLHYGTRQLAMEPWREEAHRQLMWALAANGQRSAALAQYRACRQALLKELGVEPEPETVALYEQIRQTHAAEPQSQPGKALGMTHHAPPKPRTNLVGRRDALSALQALFPRIRLVTLTGPSGSGKTRLAIATAAALASKFADGVCMVELAGLTDPALLLQAVAGALGQTAQPDLARQHGSMSYLRDKRLLLVLDSCEHLSKVVADWSNRWLDACPHLCILATSHGALNVPGEQVWPVSPLVYPPTTVNLSLDQLSTFEAVQLFVARAQEVKADFALTAANGSAIAQICQRLEGIPLALELAAARVKLLTPAEIAARLSQRIDAAIASNPGAPERHQTLHAALTWTFDALDADEQALFQQLALFVGGFSLSAVEAVVDLPDALNGLSRLIDRSLVTTETLADQTRYRMLAVIREYAYNKLIHNGEAERMRRRHAKYFLQLAEHTQLDPQADGEALWLQPEADNFSSALDWMLTHDHPGAVRLAGALTWYWWMRSALHLVRGLLQAALARLDWASPTSLDDQSNQALLLFAAGALFALWDEAAQAEQALAQARARAEENHNRPLEGLALRVLAGVAVRQKAYDVANHWIAKGLSIWQKLGGSWHIAWLYAHKGDMAWEQGDQTSAWLAYEASTKLPVNPGARAYPFRRMAYLALGRGDAAGALALCRESLQLNLASGDRQGIAACLVGVARMSVQHAQTLPETSRHLILRRAVQLLGAGEALLQTVEGRLLQADEIVYQQTTLLLCKQMDDVSPLAYAAALAEGRSMVVEQAIASALQKEEIAALEGALPPADKRLGSGHAGEFAASPTGDPVDHSSELLPLALAQLPEPLTPLIGRQQELNELLTRLQEPSVRLLTLVGAGGMGKTRLALAVARTIVESKTAALRTPTYADGVFFVSLASLTTADALVSTIATVLGITVGTDPQQTLRQFLRDKQLLLILDNFEHILPGASAVADLLQYAPGVQLLVTSRERLNVRGEQLYPVPPLHFAAKATLTEATDASAVRLFVQGAQQAQANFQLDPTNLAAVLRICQLVQGMPLGLELAAANVGVLPLHVIADEIERSANFLAADWQDAPERQRSMRAVFAWSWQLLNPTEQCALRQLAIFRGGFDRVAAQAVTGVALPILARLIQKSLIQWHESAGNEGRYNVHELLRQFATEELETAGERATVEAQHGRYYLAYLAARGLRLGRREPKEASSEIQAELDNVRQAWRWAASQGQLAELEQATYAWWQFCQFQGLEFEGRQSFAVAVEGVRRQVAISAADEAHTVGGQQLLAKLLALHANYLFAQGCDEAMAAQAREAIELGAASGGVEGETFGTFVLGRTVQELEQKREAREMWQRTIYLVHRYHPSHPESELLHEAHWMAHNFLRGSALYFGDYTGSRTHMVQALQLCQALGKRWGELYCLAALAGVDFYLYDVAAAEAGFAAALDLARILGYRRVEMVAQDGLAGVLRLRGDYPRARLLLEHAVSMAVEQVFPYDEALFLAALIRLHCQLGDQTAAAQRQEQLTRLLARVKLAKECRLYGHLAAAVKAHYAGAEQEALHAAEQADQINQQGGDILFRLVDTALILGHTRTAVGQWEAAKAAFHQALAAFQQFAGAHWAQALAAEPRAGLAQIALAQGDLAAAQVQVEAMLPVLAAEPHVGYNDPFAIYLTCYRVLTANRDERGGRGFF